VLRPPGFAYQYQGSRWRSKRISASSAGARPATASQKDNKLKWQQERASSRRDSSSVERLCGYSAEIRLAIRSTLSSGSLRRCDRIVWWCVGFVRRDACVFSNVPPASRCRPPTRARNARGVSASIPIILSSVSRQLSLVTRGLFAAALSAVNFRSSRSRTRTKALGSTGPVNSPSGWKRLATSSQSRRQIRRRIISISRRVDWFQIR
jgi:hypothetical protein